jgi:hypothetical protein
MKKAAELVRDSSLYNEFLTEREEILRHKRIESEKAGFDIGFERAMIDWIVKYRPAWYGRHQRGVLSYSRLFNNERRFRRYAHDV